MSDDDDIVLMTSVVMTWHNLYEFLVRPKTRDHSLHAAQVLVKRVTICLGSPRISSTINVRTNIW